MRELYNADVLGKIVYVDVAMVLNMSVAGVVGHQSALKDGETLDIPQFVM